MIVWLLLMCLVHACTVDAIVDSHSNQKNCRSFHIYDWPNEHMNSWPEPEKKLPPPDRRNPLAYQHVDGTNFGAGALSNPSRGIFLTKNTDQLYHMIMSRLRVHPHRTMNKDEACLFIIPMDLGVSSFFDKKTGRYVMHKGCRDTVIEGEQLMKKAVAESPLWGHDMLFINSLFTYFTLNCSTILYPCVNCTRVLYEAADTSNDGYIKYALLNGHQVTYRWFSVPHLSNIHITEEMVDFPWKRSVNSSVVSGEGSAKYLVVLWASRTVQRKKASRIRERLHKDCAMYPDQCHLHSIKNRYNGTELQSLSVVERLYGNSIFCLMPPGDGPTRKGIFDSILMGCIPVMFDKDLLSRSYEWYFTKEVDRQCAVYVQAEPYLRDKAFNIIKYLGNISRTEIQEKQSCMEKVAHTLSYAVPPARLKPYIGFGGMKTSLDGTNVTWQPPMKDAVDTLLDGMYARISRFRDTLEVPPHERNYMTKPEVSSAKKKSGKA